jgi:hypothetical protein
MRHSVSETEGRPWMPWNLLWRGSIFVRLAKTIYRIKDGPAA